MIRPLKRVDSDEFPPTATLRSVAIPDRATSPVALRRHRVRGGRSAATANSAAGSVAAPSNREVIELFREQLEAVRRQNARPLYLAAKRVFDVVSSAIGLVLLSPFIALAALLVKLSDGGPVLYTHRRVGEGGRVFRCFKFRTMIVDADEMKASLEHLNRHADPRTFKMEHDPRITRVGRWLRRTSFDEVPQLFNVLLGDMSMVGPRPPIPDEVEKYSLWEMQRLSVKPGLTCIWQVSGRSRLPFPKQLELDIEYIRKRNLLLDLRLVFATFRAVITGDGAC